MLFVKDTEKSQSSHLFITSSLSAARSTGTTVWSRYCKQTAKVATAESCQADLALWKTDGLSQVAQTE